MFHSHQLHLRAEQILTQVGDGLREFHTFQKWRPGCAIGHLASESGYIPLDPRRATSPRAGEDVVRHVFGLVTREIRAIMMTNDEAGPARVQKLTTLLRSFCPVCRPLQAMEPRSITRLLASEK